YTPFDFTTVIHSDLKLYAFFDAVATETVSVYFMNGTTLLETKTINKNTAVEAIASPTKEGHTFKGWSTSETTYTAFDFKTLLDKDLVLYAFFDAVDPTQTISVSFMNGTTLLETKTINKNTAVEAITSPTKQGHTFKGWSTNETTYTAFDFETLIEANLSLYAFFDINQYTVTYMCGTETYHTDTVSYNTYTTAPQAPNLVGSTFLGWCTDEAGEHAFNFDTPITENITLYAKLETVNTHTLHLIIDGTQTDKAINNNAVISTVITPTKEGYTFIGWFTDANYQNAFDSSTPITEDKTLYGHFQIKTYTVTFKNGTTTFSTKTVNHNAKVTAPDSPTKTGYTFKGWSTNSTTYTAFDTTTKTITEDITLYAF
ncbi:MAG: InlB B-repeat-containing protein, partial [Anaeroplasmataceae bacterium]|nr:InlB B-repeat-containing protein [Anaeroplasmataceae bacterium]